MGVQIAKKVFEIADIGLHNVKITRVEDLGLVEGGLYGAKMKILVVFECLDQQDSTGKNVEVWGRFNQSLDEKSMLGKLLACLKITVGPDEVFDTDDLLNARLQIVVVHDKTGKYANVESFIALKNPKPVAVAQKPAAPAQTAPKTPVKSLVKPKPAPVVEETVEATEEVAAEPVSEEDIPF